MLELQTPRRLEHPPRLSPEATANRSQPLVTGGEPCAQSLLHSRRLRLLNLRCQFQLCPTNTSQLPMEFLHPLVRGPNHPASLPSSLRLQLLVRRVGIRPRNRRNPRQALRFLSKPRLVCNLKFSTWHVSATTRRSHLITSRRGGDYFG